MLTVFRMILLYDCQELKRFNVTKIFVQTESLANLNFSSIFAAPL